MSNQRRWPPGEQHGSGERRGQWAGREFRGDDSKTPEIADAIGDLSKLLRALTPAVLGSATYQLDVTGIATETYKVPFASIAVVNFSANALTLANATRQAGAPGAGPGVSIIPPLCFRTVNLAGYAWTVYGGNSGEKLTVEVFSRPQPPNAAAFLMGPQTELVGTNPASGSPFVYTVTQASQLMSAIFKLNTGATVANRFANITIADALGNVVALISNNVATTASSTTTLSAAQGQAQVTSTGAAEAALPAGLVLQPGWTITLGANGLVAGDTITSIALDFQPE